MFSDSFDRFKKINTENSIVSKTNPDSAADIIISRAGAIAISELTVVGKPVILIPSPNVAENHQYKNEQYYLL